MIRLCEVTHESDRDTDPATGTNAITNGTPDNVSKWYVGYLIDIANNIDPRSISFTEITAN